LLVASLRETRTYGVARYSARSSWSVDLEGIEKLVVPELIERKLVQVKTEELEAKPKQAVEAFREAMKHKREGKPPRSILDANARVRMGA
jgi:hypothetical protein